MKKYIIVLLAIFSSLVLGQTVNSNINALDPTQVYNTTNLVNNSTSPTSTTSTWQNIGLWNQGLPCWGPGGPVYCGPLPYFNDGSFNFSYGYTDVHQIVNIANALPNSGTGLRVNGFNFGFTAKNGNGWDNGQQDYLVAYVNLYDSKGQVAKSYDYGVYTNQKYDWTQFNFSETFATPYASKDLSTVRYGFVGGDTNFWAGPYGPEVYNVSFSLKYSVDPCYVNVLSSPSCPGYLDYINKISTTPPTTTENTTQPNNTVIQPLAPTTTSISSTTTSTTISPTAFTTNVTLTSTGNNKETTVNSNGAAIGLSVIAKNQQREQSITMQAAQNAIAAADQVSQQTQQDAVNIASTSSSSSIVSVGNIARTNTTSNSANVASQQQIQTTNTTQSIYSILQPPQPQIQQIIQQNTNTNATTQSTIYALSNTQQMPTITNDFNNTDSQKMLLDRSNPLYQALENKSIETQNNMTIQQGPTVNRNVQNNELAGGVDLTRMAQAPSGYGDYLNLVLRDAAFYAPKEVYKNQKNVDNARVLRQLSSDRLHQEMVNQQYNRGN